MRIIELHAENFKRLKAVSIAPDGHLTQITGRNAQGKSSVLDAVWAALGGAAAAPETPVRKGAKKAQVRIDLGDIQVTRKFSADGKSTLVVESAGVPLPSPQAVLDKLVGQLTFDPLAFSKMPPKQQTETLRALVGMDTTQLDAERVRLFERRTAVNREVKTLQGQLAGMPPVVAPDEELSVAELAREHQRASAQKAANDEARRQAAAILTIVEGKRKEVEKLEAQLAEARRQLKIAEQDRELLAAEAAALKDPDVDAITQRMATVESTNAAVRAKRARAAKAAELDAKETAAAELTAALAKIDESKAEMLANAKFPIGGLSIDGDTITMNGVPFAQASSAEQLRCCLAIGAALNPQLRVVLVRDGSLLDADGLRLVAGWAESHDMQVLLERVADGAPAGVVIEDGEVAAVHRATAKAAATIAAAAPAPEPEPEVIDDGAFPAPEL